MMRLLLSFIIALITIEYSFSQEGKTIYFVSAAPEMFYEQKSYLSMLYEYTTDSLRVLDTLTSGSDMMTRFVGVYPFYESIYLYEENELRNKGNNLIFVDTNNLIKINKKDITGTINPWPVLIEKNKESYYCLNNDINSEEIKYYGYNQSLQKLQLESNDFQNTYLRGVVGAPVKNEDNKLLVYTDIADGRLYIPVTKNTDNRPVFPIILPSEYQLHQKKRLSIYINDENYFVIKLDKSSILNQSTFLINKKGTNSWQLLKVLGDETRIQSFNYWITGVIVEFDKKNDRISPGENSRRQLPNSYGPGFDMMAKLMSLYYPGILFLYNVSDKTYIEWATNQGDSEILLVQDDTVYYRINDKIYKAPILEGRELGQTKLLVQDNKVRDIHWAFFSK